MERELTDKEEKEIRQESEAFWKSDEGKKVVEEARQKAEEFHKDFVEKCYVSQARLNEPFTI